jgi:hypothetical protein
MEEITMSTPDIIRVIRMYVFEGPRHAVEAMLSRSLQDGTHQRASGLHGLDAPLVTIHAATIGQFPEIIRQVTATPSDPAVAVIGDQRWLVWEDTADRRYWTDPAALYKEIRAKHCLGFLSRYENRWLFYPLNDPLFDRVRAQEAQPDGTPWPAQAVAEAEAGAVVDAGTVYDASRPEEPLPGVPDAGDEETSDR